MQCTVHLGSHGTASPASMLSLGAARLHVHPVAAAFGPTAHHRLHFHSVPVAVPCDGHTPSPNLSPALSTSHLDAAPKRGAQLLSGSGH